MSPVIPQNEPKVPFLVKNLYGLTALSSLLTFPLILVVYQLFEHGDRMIHQVWHSVPIADPPLFPVSIIALMLAFSIAWLPGCAVASHYIVRLVRFHLDHGDEKAAEQALLKYSNQLWYRDIRKNTWLLEFIVQRHLWEKADRFARFSR
jgi:hypothetical protein